MVEAYPLNWPEYQPRTPASRRQRSRFDTSFALARDCLADEVVRLSGNYPIISSNVHLKRDGMPYANHRAPDDPGVAVYFQYEGESVCFACDKWDRVKDNIQAIRKTIEALRGIERWGSTDMMQRAFRGFAELPCPHEVVSEHWQDVLQTGNNPTLKEAECNFRILARDVHPDTADEPDEEAFHKLVRAREQARRALK